MLPSLLKITSQLLVTLGVGVPSSLFGRPNGLKGSSSPDVVTLGALEDSERANKDKDSAHRQGNFSE